jgi:hypothetical protein
MSDRAINAVVIGVGFVAPVAITAAAFFTDNGNWFWLLIFPIAFFMAG